MKKLTLLFGLVMCLFGTTSAQSYPDIILLDCEDITELHARFRGISGQTMEIVDNPLQDAVNGSSKALKMTPAYSESAGTIDNRCILNLDVTRNQEEEDMIATTGYTNVKFKYYSPTITGSELVLQLDATSDYAYSEFPEGGKWEEFDILFPWDDTNWELFQFIFNQNKSWNGTVPEDNLIYIDDIVVYSTNSTGINDAATVQSLTCYSTSEGEAVLSLATENAMGIQADLYSVCGQLVKNIYSGKVNGSLNVPFSVAAAGVYLVKVSDAAGVAKTIKLIVK